MTCFADVFTSEELPGGSDPIYFWTCHASRCSSACSIFPCWPQVSHSPRPKQEDVRGWALISYALQCKRTELLPLSAGFGPISAVARQLSAWNLMQLGAYLSARVFHEYSNLQAVSLPDALFPVMNTPII